MSIKALTLANAAWKPTQSSPIEAKTLTKKTVMLVSAMTVFPTIAAASIALCTPFFRFKMQGGKIICKRFSTANPFNATIGSKQQLLRTQLTIVIKAHRLTVCASVLNNQQVTIHDRRQSPRTPRASYVQQSHLRRSTYRWRQIPLGRKSQRLSSRSRHR